MTRTIVAGLVVAGLALGIWFLWPDGGPTGNTATTVVASPTTTVTVAAVDSSTTTTAETTSTLAESHIVETVEEAEEILRELWFGWFEGIYNQDEDRIREVVATDHQHVLALGQFGSMQFERMPDRKDILFTDSDILLADNQCLVIHTTTQLTGFTNANTTDVHILRQTDLGWKFFGLWSRPSDLWESDCDASLQSS